MSLELKIKAKHLGEEAKIIRFEENKLRKQIEWAKSRQQQALAADLRDKRDNINFHRRFDVRDECRATQLARALIAKVPYDQVERKRRKGTEWRFSYFIVPRIAAMVAKYRDRSRYVAIEDPKNPLQYQYSKQLLTEIKQWCNVK